MADSDDAIPPIPTPPADLGDSPVVPPVETPPEAPYGAAPVEPAPAAPTAAPAPAPAASAAPYGAAAPGVTPPPAQPGYPAQPYAAQPYAAQPAGPAQGLAITSMILGIVGLLLALVGFGFLPSLAAVITGHLAQRRQPWAKPFWLTGVITGWVGVGIGLLTGLFILFFLVLGFASFGAYNY